MRIQTNFIYFIILTLESKSFYFECFYIEFLALNTSKYSMLLPAIQGGKKTDWSATKQPSIYYLAPGITLDIGLCISLFL